MTLPRGGYGEGEVRFVHVTPPRRNAGAQMNASDDNETVSHLKRQRVSKACDLCRQGKLKCNGAVPQCSTCLQAKKSCTYGAPKKRRGLRTGYVRAIECLLGLVFQSVEGSVPTVEKLLSTTSRKSFWFGDDVSDHLYSTEHPLDSWKSSGIPQVIDAILSNEDASEDDHDSNTTDPSAQTHEHFVAWQLPRDPTTIPSRQQQTENVTGVLCQRCQDTITTHGQWLDRDGTIQHTANADPNEASAPTNQHGLAELPRNAQKLLEHYFAFTHSWFPIIERITTFKIFFSYRKALTSKDFDSPDSGDCAILWATFALAALTSQTSDTEQSNREIRTNSVDKMFTTARKLVSWDDEDGISVGHVQTMLILGLYRYTLCQWKTARTLVGQATILASHIGLDQKSNCKTEYQQRTWLGCFVLDTLTAAHIESTPRLRVQDVAAYLPTEEAGTDEWEPWHLQEALSSDSGADVIEFSGPTHTLSVFNRLLGIICIYSDVLCSATNEKCMRSLDVWIKTLPEHIAQFFNASSKAISLPCPPNILNLYLLRALMYVRSSSTPSRPQDLQPSNHFPEYQSLIQLLNRSVEFVGQQAIPPLLHLLRTVDQLRLSQTGTVSDLISEIAQDVLNRKAVPQFQAQLETLDHTDTSVHSSDRHNRTWAVMTSPQPTTFDPSQWATQQTVGNENLGPKLLFYNPDPPYMEQNIGSFTNTAEIRPHSGSGLHLCPDIAARESHSSTHAAALPLYVPEVSSETLSLWPSNPLDEVTLDAFKAWDDLEVQNQDQFSKNLGYVL